MRATTPETNMVITIRRHADRRAAARVSFPFSPLHPAVAAFWGCSPTDRLAQVFAGHYDTANDSEEGTSTMTTNFADLQREHDAADISLRLKLGTEYSLLSSEGMRRARTEWIRNERGSSTVDTHALAEKRTLSTQ